MLAVEIIGNEDMVMDTSVKHKKAYQGLLMTIINMVSKNGKVIKSYRNCKRRQASLFFSSWVCRGHF